MAPVSGTVRIELPGASTVVSLDSQATVPVGTTIDTTDGRVRLITAKDTGGHTQTGLFDSGWFSVSQTIARSRLHARHKVGLTVLKVAGQLPSGCAGRSATASAKHRHGVRELWGNAKGNYRSVGHYGAATVRGTKWLTRDTCAGTLVRVARGVVSVNDFTRHRTVLVRAPNSYLARAH